MERINKVHALCANGCLKTDTCSHCIWLEWDRNTNECLNQQSIVCPIYRDRLLKELHNQTEC